MIAARHDARRLVEWLLVAVASALLLLHGAGWIATAIVFWQRATLHLPRTQSAIVIGLAILVLRAASAPRRHRRVVVIGALIVAAGAFITVPLPQEFEGHALMPGGVDTARDHREFERRFRVDDHVVNFHSHLGDVVMATLDATFGRSDTSPARAYIAMSWLAGLLFLLELGVAAAWHKWSRHSCRYVGLMLATPLCLLFFGYWEIGYLAVAVGVVPLLAVARGRSAVQADAATLAAGALQGVHTALHGFGTLGLAGGALAALAGRGTAMRRVIRSTTFTSAGVALYLGWVFLYVTVAGLAVVWSRQLGYRPMFEAVVFDKRIAYPLLSPIGLGEFGLFSVLSGVPVLALAIVMCRRAALVPAILYALPGLFFLIRWWPVSAPYNLDLLLSVFPGVFAACWIMAGSRRKSLGALIVLVGMHIVLWTTLGSGVFERVWVDAAQ